MKQQLESIKNKQLLHIANSGGILAIRECDDDYNDMNRELIAAFKDLHGSAFLGNINFYDKHRDNVASGAESVYKEYVGQKVYNFGCSFVVPLKDEPLEEMIREWNRDGIRSASLVDAISNRVEELGGINLLWF